MRTYYLFVPEAYISIVHVDRIHCATGVKYRYLTVELLRHSIYISGVLCSEMIKELTEIYN